MNCWLLFSAKCFQASAAYPHIRVEHYLIEVASSLEVLSIVQSIRSPFKKRDEVLGLTLVQTVLFLFVPPIKVSEPPSSVKDIDAAIKDVRAIMKKYSNKLRNSRYLQTGDPDGTLPRKESPDVARPPRNKTSKRIFMAEFQKMKRRAIESLS